MKILRLTNSSDSHPGVPPELRSPGVCERLIHEATGEPVETMLRGMWPTSALPAAVDRWMEQFQPDVVFFRLSSFWVAYESVPLRVERRLGKLGRPVATAGLRLGDWPWLVERRAFKATRRVVTRAIGGDTHFTPGEAAAVLDAVFHRVVARESVVPVVRGTSLLLNSAGTPAGLQRSKRRVAELNALTAEACARLHIPFFAEAPAEAVSGTRLADDLHDSEAAHSRLGEDDGKAIVAAWLAARPT